MKISEAFDLYKNNYMFYKNRSVRVLQNHEYVKSGIVNLLGDKRLEKLTLDDVQKWASSISKGRHWNTVRNDIIRLRAVLKYARLRNINCINPDLIPIPKRVDSIKDYLTADEVRSMIDCSDRLRNKFMISFFYSSGVRLSEFLSLNRDSVRNRQFQVVGKGGKLRLCFIDERTSSLMRKYLRSRNDDNPALVITYRGHNRMSKTNVQFIIKNAAKKAEINKHVTPHTLRHSFATNFVKNNGSISYLSTILGHASVSTTEIYTHIVNNDLKNQYLKFHSI